MERIHPFTKILLWLAIIGALIWGFVGFANWNPINAIFGAQQMADNGIVPRIIYALVGLAGLGLIGLLPKLREVPGGHPRRAEVTR